MNDDSTGSVEYPSDSDRKIAHYLKRMRSIRLGEWTAYSGSFADHLLSQADPESNSADRLRRMRTMLLHALDTGIGDMWIEIADVSDVLVTDEDRLWFTAEWNATR